MLLKSLTFIFLIFKWTESSNILGVFPMGGSHNILASKLMKGLAEAGHNVTMVTPYKLKDPPTNGNYTEIILEGFEEEFHTFVADLNLYEMELQNPLKQLMTITRHMVNINNKTVHHRNVKKLLQSNVQFDAVITEQFMNDILKVFSHIYACPLIILSSQGPNEWINPLVGNPQPVSTVPAFAVRTFSPDSIFDRTINAFYHLAAYSTSIYYLLPKFDSIMHEAFPSSPPLYDLYTNVSLILLNSHTSIYSAVPMVPNMVEIGGHFIDPPKKLPEDLQEFLDSAKNGAIYFSMGSTLKSKDISGDKKRAIINALGKLKQKVIWKFEEDLPKKPSNVMIKKWLPQRDILAHPNIKLFITHSGLLSTIETIYNGVPILAIPIYGDELVNAQKAVETGFGLKVEYHGPNFSEENLSFLINELVNNPKYKKNAQERSKIFHDRPQKPMETAVYWVEYVIRHKGAPHLRIAGVTLPWYKYFMVDVIGSLILGLFIVSYSFKLVLKKLFCKNKNSFKKQKEQ